TATALKKLVKGWLEQADNRTVEIYAYVGPYEFPDKVLATIPEPVSEAEPQAEAKTDGVSAAEVEKLHKDYEKKLEKADAELAKIKKLLDQAQGKRESDLTKAEESFKRERDQLQAKLAEASSSSKRLQEEVSAKSQPISQLKRDLEDSLRQGERLTKDLAEAKGGLETAEKKRDEAVAKRDEIAAQAKAAQQEVADLKGTVTQLEKKLEEAGVASRYLDEARTWMLIDRETLQEVVENMETELDVRSDFKEKFNLDFSKPGSAQHRAIDLAAVWKKLLSEEKEIVDEFFDVALQSAVGESDKFRDAVSRLYDLKDSLLAREMAALALNEICSRFLDRKKAPPTPAKA
ncbi:MAG: hypothetical protein KGR26_00935, partial [Cyanobacteria bacterium REEB65]|nr:hypothetical protein [Cyanobacteria bacterium REEB65]